MDSPSLNPITDRIFLRTSCSMRMKTGAISYVNLVNIYIREKNNLAMIMTYMLVLAAAVSHSPARETMSSPHDN